MSRFRRNKTIRSRSPFRRQVRESLYVIQCLLLARSRVVKTVYCQPMAAEFSEKLRETFGFSENRIHATMYDLRSMADQVEITADLHVVADDPDDDMFVECAVVAGASLIVSDDHHLLDLKEYQGIHIISSDEFVARFTRFS